MCLDVCFPGVCHFLSSASYDTVFTSNPSIFSPYQLLPLCFTNVGILTLGSFLEFSQVLWLGPFLHP